LKPWSGRVKFGFQGISYPDVDQTLDWARRADEAGFDVAAMPDHLFHPRSEVFLSKGAWDAHAVLGATAATTRNIRMMQAVTDTVRRHPATTAHFITTLDRISHGRAMLGIGAGELFNFQPLGDVVWERPVARLREALRVIRALWTATKEDPATFEGEYFSLKEAWLGLLPVQNPHPPIYVGGYGPKMKALVAEVADGWLPWLETPETYRRASDHIASEARKIGRDPAEIDMAVEIFTAITKDESEVARIAQRASIGMSLRQDLLRQMGYPGLADESVDVLRARFREEDWKKINSVAARIPPEAVKSLIVSGTPDQAIERLEEYRRAGVRTFILISPTDLIYQNMAAYRDKIIPHFAGERA
jgi:alkanesulfonate monooxygenase SsuD/methylene tetrahydromethanopterin reductase-like flavin-dependent oxidoreductase (luciferase family)